MEKPGLEIYRKRIETVVGNVERDETERLKAFLICPVRGHSLEETASLVNFLESDLGIDIHWPHRDTDQNDKDGLKICEQNRAAIKNADVVFIVWDGKSTGSLFDLGMTFALKKLLVPLELPPATQGKSFQNMMIAWFDSINGPKEG